MVFMDFNEQAYLTLLQSNSGDVYREVPVHLRIANIELLSPEDAWTDGGRTWGTLHLSIIEVARYALLRLRAAKQFGEYVWDIGESAHVLLFRMSGEDVIVHSSVADKTVQVSYAKLEKSWEDFAEKVRQFLLREYPTLKEEPVWKEWFMGKEDSFIGSFIRLEDTSWRFSFNAYKEELEHIDAYEP